MSADYFPLAAGDTWVYDTHCFCLPLVEVLRVTGPVMTGGEAVLTATMSWPDLTTSPQSAYLVRDGGLKVLQGSSLHFVLPHHSFTGELVRFGVPFEPLIFEVLDQDPNWDHDGDGIKDRLDYRYFLKVSGYETTTVPAGTFQNVLRLQYEVEITLRTSKLPSQTVVEPYFTEWRAPGIGVIKQSRKAPQFPYFVTDTDRHSELLGAKVQGVTVGDISAATAD